MPQLTEIADVGSQLLIHDLKQPARLRHRQAMRGRAWRLGLEADSQ
jgi:hypothetical protein